MPVSSLVPPKTSEGGGGGDVAPSDWATELRGNETLKRRRATPAEAAVRRGMGQRNCDWRTERCGVEEDGTRRAEGFMAPSVMRISADDVVWGLSVEAKSLSRVWDRRVSYRV